MGATLESLRRHELPGLVRVEAGPAGFPGVVIATPLAQAQLFLHGAHVTHYQPAGHSPLLFLSERSLFRRDKAIRGGVPVIFPWFGPSAISADLPMHGFARTREWELEGVEKWPDDTVSVVLRLLSDETTRALWPHDFVLRHRIVVGRQLEMRLEVENWSEVPFTFEEALHTYLAVRDVRQTAVTGLDGVTYLDKTDNLARKTQRGTMTVEAETDRVYLETSAACTVDDAAGGRTLRVAKDGSKTTVVWNPWVAKAAALADFGDDEWPRMLCVETANAGHEAITLAPHATHIMSAIVSVQR